MRGSTDHRNHRPAASVGGSSNRSPIATIVCAVALLSTCLLARTSPATTPPTAASAAGSAPECGALPVGVPAPAIHLPPRPDGPTILGVGIEILAITNVDVLRGQFRMRARVDFAWCDPRLGAEARAAGTDVMYLSGSNVSEKLEETWNANLSMTNEIGAPDVGKREMTIGSDGRIHVSGTFERTLAVNLDLRRFPFDDQVLAIDIEPFGWSRDQVVLETDDAHTGIVKEFELAEWAVGEIEARVVDVTRTGTDRLFSQLQITIPIHRRSGFYIWKAILPLMLIVALSWSVFWIKESAAGRIRICATVMLTIVAYQFATAADLPKLPYMTLFTAFTTLSFLSVFLAVVVIVASFYRKDARDDSTAVERSDRIARWLIPLLYFLGVATLLVVYTS